MVKCVVRGCESETRYRVPGVTFHRFPKDDGRRSIWIYNLRLLSDPIKSKALVCSLHFENSCYQQSSKVRRLVVNACPTKLLGSVLNNMDSEDTTSAPEENNVAECQSQAMPVVPPPLNNNFVEQPAVDNPVNPQDQDSPPSSKSSETDSSSSGDSTGLEDCPLHEEHNSKATLEVTKQSSSPGDNRAVASTGNVILYQMEHFKRSLYIQKLKNRLNRAKLRSLKKCEKIRHLKYKMEKYKAKCQNMQYQSNSSTSTQQQPNGFSYCVSGYYGASGFGN